jgi:hypothetical protein
MLFIKSMLRYYDNFFNSLGSAIALEFFSSSGKHTEQNQNLPNLEAVATPLVPKASLKNNVTYWRRCILSGCRSGNSEYPDIPAILGLVGRAPQRPKSATYFFASPEWKGGGDGSLTGTPVNSQRQNNRPMIEEGV